MKNESINQKKYIKHIRIRRKAVLIVQVSLLVAFMFLWQLCSDKGIIDAFIFSSPRDIFLCALQMLKNSSLLYHTAVTAAETITGFLTGTLLGTAIAVVLWWNSFINDVSEPYLVVLNSLPKTALAPIIIVWVGNNVFSIIAVALFTSVIVTVLNVLSAFNETDKDMIKLIYTLGGKKIHVLLKVILPSNIPAVMNALKVNIGLSFVGVIVGEFLVAKNGLGYLIIYGSQIFRLNIVLLSVVILAVLSALLYRLVTVFQNYINRHMGLK